MGSRSIELHDSVIQAVEFLGGSAVIRFSHAYVHKSDGTPGVDRGTGWSHRAELTIKDATQASVPPHPPYSICNGILRLGEVEHPNEIPIPLSCLGDVSIILSLVDATGEFSEVTISGSGAELELSGEADYIEDFPGLTAEDLT